jgi:50S ribosomal protein L16 3-hydroxylase
MNIQEPIQLLGGLSPQTFMRKYWQKKPLLIRGAIPNFSPLLSRSELLALAAQDTAESRLIIQNTSAQGASWRLRQGPFQRKSLPPLKQPGWTLLVQGVDLHDDGVHQLMQQFRFIPDARLDDLMISYATDGGGVGPHFDSYDVFLLQAQGTRRWRIGRQKDLRLQPDVPLKILANFEPEQEFVLEPGDMLYLPPRYAHDGIAQGECMTYSIGFRAPSQGEMAKELMQRMAEEAQEELGAKLYRDPQQSAVSESAEIPAELLAFSQATLQAAMQTPGAVLCTLGEYLTEPKAMVWFEGQGGPISQGITLDRRTRMLYAQSYIFVNGEAFCVSGRDATLMRQLANERGLRANGIARLSAAAKAQLTQWCEVGWLHAVQG